MRAPGSCSARNGIPTQGDPNCTGHPSKLRHRSFHVAFDRQLHHGAGRENPTPLRWPNVGALASKSCRPSPTFALTAAGLQSNPLPLKRLSGGEASQWSATKVTDATGHLRYDAVLLPARDDTTLLGRFALIVAHFAWVLTSGRRHKAALAGPARGSNCHERNQTLSECRRCCGWRNFALENGGSAKCRDGGARSLRRQGINRRGILCVGRAF